MLTELSIKDIVQVELNGEKPYFVTYNRDLVDKDGNPIKIVDSPLQWVKEVKGDIVLTENMKIYDLSRQ